jgi:hypothetical protein
MAVIDIRRPRPPGRLSVAVTLAVVICAATASAARAATIVVTSHGDDSAVNGSVSLREAIESIDAGANINSDVIATGTYGSDDTIDFDIQPAGRQTISPTSNLPSITKPVTIDAHDRGRQRHLGQPRRRRAGPGRRHRRADHLELHRHRRRRDRGARQRC